MRWRPMYQPTIPGGAEPPRPALVPENLSAEPSFAERRPIIGREREIAALTAAVTSGSPAPVVVISGPHGSGKTLLLNHTRRHAEAAGRIALRTAGVPAQQIDYADLLRRDTLNSDPPALMTAALDLISPFLTRLVSRQVRAAGAPL